MSLLEASCVSTIITTFNDYTNTLECLERVLQQENISQRIIVVDNGSENSYVDNLLFLWKELVKKYNKEKNLNLEEPIELFSIERSLAKAILLRLPSNEGYPLAINSAIQICLYDKDCHAFWFLHNDCIPEKYTLSALIQHTKEEKNSQVEEFHIIGSTFLSKDPQFLECAAGGKISSFSGKIKFADENISRYSLSQREKLIKEINFIYGASFLVKREVFETIGLFTEKLFMYHEDIDFSLRATSANYKLNWAPGAIVTHKVKNTDRLAPARFINQIDKNEFILLPKFCALRNRFYLIKKLRPKSYYLSLLSWFFPLSINLLKGRGKEVKNILKAAIDGFKL